MPTVYEYRKKRYALHLDDKILTSWNGLMIAAMCRLHRITGEIRYLEAAKRAQDFIEGMLCEDGTLFVSWREGKRSEKGFLDDYANEVFALLALYHATLEKKYLNTAIQFLKKSVTDFYDEINGGFYLYGTENEQLIFRPKETYDGAIPSGNSMMFYNLVQLYYLTEEVWMEELIKKQVEFMSAKAGDYPNSYAMFLTALLMYHDPGMKVTIVAKNLEDLKQVPCKLPLNAIVRILEEASKEFPRKDNRTTYYVCKGRSCMPASNELDV